MEEKKQQGMANRINMANCGNTCWLSSSLQMLATIPGITTRAPVDSVVAHVIRCIVAGKGSRSRIACNEQLLTNEAPSMTKRMEELKIDTVADSSPDQLVALGVASASQLSAALGLEAYTWRQAVEHIQRTLGFEAGQQQDMLTALMLLLAELDSECKVVGLTSTVHKTNTGRKFGGWMVNMPGKDGKSEKHRVVDTDFVDIARSIMGDAKFDPSVVAIAVGKSGPVIGINHQKVSLDSASYEALKPYFLSVRDTMYSLSKADYGLAVEVEGRNRQGPLVNPPPKATTQSLFPLNIVCNGQTTQDALDVAMRPSPTLRNQEGGEPDQTQQTLHLAQLRLQTRTDFVLLVPQTVTTAAKLSAHPSPSIRLGPPDVVDQPWYDLVACVSHTGASRLSGHYIAYVSDGVGGWWLLDDGRVEVEHRLAIVGSVAATLYRRR
jgi:hypothetical protein